MSAGPCAAALARSLGEGGVCCLLAFSALPFLLFLDPFISSGSYFEPE